MKTIHEYEWGSKKQNENLVYGGFKRHFKLTPFIQQWLKLGQALPNVGVGAGPDVAVVVSETNWWRDVINTMPISMENIKPKTCNIAKKWLSVFWQYKIV